jgi:hypothetical protein
MLVIWQLHIQNIYLSLTVVEDRQWTRKSFPWFILISDTNFGATIQTMALYAAWVIPLSQETTQRSVKTFLAFIHGIFFQYFVHISVCLFFLWGPCHLCLNFSEAWQINDSQWNGIWKALELSPNDWKQSNYLISRRLFK